MKFIKNSSISTQDLQSDNYNLESQSFVYEMLKNAFPQNYRVNSIIPYAYADGENFTGQSATTNVTLYGRLFMYVPNGSEITVYVLNDQSAIIPLKFIGTASIMNYEYHGLISYIVVNKAGDFPMYSFNGWKIAIASQGEAVAPIVNSFFVQKNSNFDYFNQGLYGFDTLTPIAGFSTVDAGNAQVYSLAGRDDCRFIAKLSRGSVGLFTDEYPNAFNTSGTLVINVVSAIADAGATGYWFVTVEVTGILSQTVAQTINIDAAYAVLSSYTPIVQSCANGGGFITYDYNIDRNLSTQLLHFVDNIVLPQLVRVEGNVYNDILALIASPLVNFSDTDLSLNTNAAVPELGGTCPTSCVLSSILII